MRLTEKEEERKGKSDRVMERERERQRERDRERERERKRLLFERTDKASWIILFRVVHTHYGGQVLKLKKRASLSPIDIYKK